MVKISGILRTTSPLFCAAPGDERFDFKTGKFSSNKETSVPCSRVRHDRIAQIGIEVQDSGSSEENSDNTPQNAFVERATINTPIFPSNDFRGGLHRCAADKVCEAVEKKGKSLSLDAYHTLTSGASIGSPDSSTPSIKDTKEVLDHPYFGLFGGTTKMIGSCLKVQTLYPICPATVSAGIASERFASFKTGTNYLTQISMFRKDDDVEKDIPASFIRVNKNAEAEIEQWRQFLDGKAVRPDNADPDKSSIRTWSSREVVIPGVPFEVGLVVDTHDHAKIGLLLLALERQIEKNYIGGRSAIGYGRFTAMEFSLEQNGSTHKLFIKNGDATLLNINDSIIKEYVDAAQEFLEDVDVDAIERMSRPEMKISAEDKKAAAALKKAKKAGE